VSYSYMNKYFKNIINYYQNHKILVIFATFGFLIILNIIFSGNPAKKEGFNTWNNITVGDKVSQDQLKALNPISIEENSNGTSYKYESSFKSFPNEVVVSKNNSAQFIKEYLVADKNHTLDYYISQLGEYDLEMEVPEIGHTVSAAIFLKEGLVVVHYSTSEIRTVVQKWYFEPMNESDFLKTWGNSLKEHETEAVPHPPVFDPDF